MNSKSFFVIILSLFLALVSRLTAVAAYVPHQETISAITRSQNLGNGTGDYAGYSEQTIINGTETMNGVNADGIVSAHYSYSMDLEQQHRHNRNWKLVWKFHFLINQLSFTLTELTTRRDMLTQLSGSSWITQSQRAAPFTF